MTETNRQARFVFLSMFFSRSFHRSSSFRPSLPYRAEYTPGAPSRASTARPESSALAGRPVASMMARALIRAFSSKVAPVSAGIVDDEPLLDLCYQEDSSAMVDLDCVMTGEGELVELQGTGEGRAFTIQEQRTLVDLCAKGIRELKAIQKAVIEGEGK